MATIHVSRKRDGTSKKKSEHFEPLYMFNKQGELINKKGEIVSDEGEKRRIIEEAEKAEREGKAEKAYVHAVDSGGFLVMEVLSKEGTLGISVYDRQLVRLANGVFADLRYIRGLKEFPSGVITKGTESIYYDLRYPYQEPIFARDEKGKEIKRWLD